jgi:hypothetical protein
MAFPPGVACSTLTGDAGLGCAKRNNQREVEPPPAALTLGSFPMKSFIIAKSCSIRFAENWDRMR